MKATMEQILQLSESYNARVTFLLFIAMKLEISLKEYLMQEKYGLSVTADNRASANISQLRVIWSFFLSNKENGESLTVETFTKAFKWTKEFMLVLYSWEKHLKGLLNENRKREEGMDTVCLEGQDILKIDLLLSNIQRCIEKFKTMLLLIYCFFS